VTTKETDDESNHRNLTKRRCIVMSMYFARRNCVKSRDLLKDICLNENGYGTRKFSYEEKVKYLYCTYCIYFILFGSRSIFAARKQSNLFCVLCVKKKLFYYCVKSKSTVRKLSKIFYRNKHH